MSAVAAPPRGLTRLHLDSFRALEHHLHDPRHEPAYARLLDTFGLDAGRFAELRCPGRLALAEPAGSWFFGEDLIRHRLLLRLRQSGLFHDRSGPLMLGADAFTCRGIKRLAITLLLHRELGPVSLVGAAAIRRFRNRVYRALPIEGAVYDRLAATLDIATALLDAARVSPEVFARETLGIFRQGLRAGLRPLLPSAVDRRRLVELGAELQDHDLERAILPLEAARRELVPGQSWPAYWRQVTSLFLDEPVGYLGPLFDRFLLAVEDPIKMARALFHESRHPRSEPLAVAAIITEEEKYRMVFFDHDTENFFLRPRPETRRTITWDTIRELASRGRSGGPSGTLEYLLMAASGLYLIASPEDGQRPFELRARAIHERLVGTPFPYVALPAEVAPEAHAYLEIFTDTFERQSRQAFEHFFR